MNQEDPDLDILNTLRTKRAEVLKNAELKFDELKKTIVSLSSKGRIRDTIIFATDKQIDGTLEYLNSINITRSKILEEIIKEYNQKDFLYNICTKKELDFLKYISNKELSVDDIKKYDWEIKTFKQISI